MIYGTPRDANSLSPVPSAARPSCTARRMLFSFMDRTKLPSRGAEFHIRLVTQVQGPSSRHPLRRGRHRFLTRGIIALRIMEAA